MKYEFAWADGTDRQPLPPAWAKHAYDARMFAEEVADWDHQQDPRNPEPLEVHVYDAETGELAGKFRVIPKVMVHWRAIEVEP